MDRQGFKYGMVGKWLLSISAEMFLNIMVNHKASQFCGKKNAKIHLSTCEQVCRLLQKGWEAEVPPSLVILDSVSDKFL